MLIPTGAQIIRNLIKEVNYDNDILIWNTVYRNDARPLSRLEKESNSLESSYLL